ncbi:MAG: tetratricopeptide repeat protein [bacterium]
MKKTIIFLLIIPFLVIGDEGKSHYLKAKAYEKSKDFYSAIIEYKKALLKDPDSIELKTSLAFAYLYNHEEDLALKVFLSIAKTKPEIWHTIGRICVKQKRYKSAIEAYNQALKIKENTIILYDLAEAYLFAKKIDGAISTYKRIIELSPKEEPALLSLGLIYDKEKKIKDAIEIYEKILSINPNNTFAIKRLILYNMSKNPESSEKLSLILLEKEKSPESYLLLGISLEKNKKEREAEKCYRRTVELGLKEGFVRLGWLLFKNERDDEGLKLAKEGLERFPEDFSLLVLYGVLLSQKKEHQRAISIFKDLLKRNPNDDYLYFQLGVAYDGLLNKNWAIKYLYKAIRLNPKNSAGYNYIGYTWVEEGKNLNRAMRLIEKALEIEPDNPAYIDSLGWCYYKMGNLDLALSLLLKAYNLKNDDPVILEHIGDVYNDKGMKKEAEKFLNLSLDKFKEERDKERIRKKF